MLPILAQASNPAVLSGDSLISWTILLFLLGVAVVCGGVLVRLARVEADRKDDRTKLELLETKQAATGTEVAVLTSTLGRIEASQARIEAAVLGQSRKSA